MTFWVYEDSMDHLGFLCTRLAGEKPSLHDFSRGIHFWCQIWSKMASSGTLFLELLIQNATMAKLYIKMFRTTRGVDWATQRVDQRNSGEVEPRNKFDSERRSWGLKEHTGIKIIAIGPTKVPNLRGKADTGNGLKRNNIFQRNLCCKWVEIKTSFQYNYFMQLLLIILYVI